MHRLSTAEIEKIFYLYCKKEQSLTIVARAVGRDTTTVARCLKGKVRTRSSAQLLAIKKGRKINPTLELNRMWKGGRHKTNYGYIRILLSPEDPFYSLANTQGYALEHRYILSHHLGRLLEDNEVVHHLNGIRDDNRICNLGIVTYGNHPHHTLQKHLQKRIKELEAKLAQQKLPL